MFGLPWQLITLLERSFQNLIILTKKEYLKQFNFASLVSILYWRLDLVLVFLHKMAQYLSIFSL